jgi:hypothetical protein
MALTRIGNPAIADVRGVNFRNIIINGGMDIAQRGTSHTTASGYTLDRWHLNDGTSGEFTVTQSTTVPTGQGFSSSYKLDCTTADASPSSSEYLIFNQRIEGQNLQYIKKGTSSAESLTLSFYVRSNKTGDYVAELRDADNTRNNTIKYTISSADTWEKKTLTFAGDTSGALDNDNARSFDVNFWLLAGSNYTSGSFSSNTWSSITDANRAVGGTNIADSTSNEWYITGIQLETGSQASDFEFLPFDYQLRSCQKYYYQTYDYGTAFGTATYTGVPQRFTDNTSNYTSLQMFHPVPMRSAPSIVVYNPNTGGTGSGTTDSNVNKDIAAIQISQKYAHLHASDVSVSKSASIRCHITANSEL